VRALLEAERRKEGPTGAGPVAVAVAVAPAPKKPAGAAAGGGRGGGGGGGGGGGKKGPGAAAAEPEEPGRRIVDEDPSTLSAEELLKVQKKLEKKLKQIEKIREDVRAGAVLEAEQLTKLDGEAAVREQLAKVLLAAATKP
jgi:hypothetical protein